MVLTPPPAILKLPDSATWAVTIALSTLQLLPAQATTLNW
jgi:hypothetical protein